MAALGCDGVSLAFRNLSYWVPIDAPRKAKSQLHPSTKPVSAPCVEPEPDVPTGRGRRGKVPRVLLSNVNGAVLPGQILGIFGSTGAGKSTLLNVLAQRAPKAQSSGDVLLNGRRVTEADLRGRVAYVIQRDIVMGTLTVRESLQYSADLRLSHLGAEERAERVREVIRQLGLAKCADTRIGGGDMMKPGISGGEVRRLRIGMELVTRPHVLVLDEPTTGLDAATANSVMRAIHALATAGHTVVLSIHQPRYSILRLIHRVLLLHEGRAVFLGAVADALQFFEGQGLHRDPLNQPGDFFLDCITGMQRMGVGVEEVKEGEDGEVGGAEGDLVGGREGGGEEGGEEGGDIKQGDAERGDANGGDTQGGVAQGGDVELGEIGRKAGASAEPSPPEVEHDLHQGLRLADAYEQAPYYSALLAEIDAMVAAAGKEGSSPRAASPSRAAVRLGASATLAPWSTQIRVLGQRSFRHLVRNPATSFMSVVMYALFGALLGAFYWDLGTDLAGLQNRTGAIFFCISNAVFSAMDILEVLVRDNALFAIEHSNHYYGVATFIFSKLIVEVIPSRALVAIAFSSIFYWMANLKATLAAFLFFVFVFFLASLAAATLSMFLTAAFGNVTIASALFSTILVVHMVFGGLLLNLDSIPLWLRWLEATSFYKYSNIAILTSEMRDAQFTCADLDDGNSATAALFGAEGTAFNTTICPVTGEAYLQSQGVDPDDMWRDALLIIVFVVVHSALAFAVLHWKTRRR